jgi:hypothetical protein
MARALQAYIERQGVKLQVAIEPIIIAGDPGLHIESVRPAIKVMMIDGIKSFVNGLVTGKPVLRADFVLDYTERILNPRMKQEMPPPGLEPEPEPEPSAGWEPNWLAEPAQKQQPEISRARTIFDASAEPKSFDPDDFGFALAEDDAAAQAIPSVKRGTNSAAPVRQNKAQQQRILGMTPVQLAIIVALGLAFLCVLAALVYVFTLS